jgi:hypothetical protein
LFWESINSLPGFFSFTGIIMKEATKTVPANDVDEYMAMVPEKERAVLSELRRTIWAAAPMAKESICYRDAGVLPSRTPGLLCRIQKPPGFLRGE